MLKHSLVEFLICEPLFSGMLALSQFAHFRLLRGGYFIEIVLQLPLDRRRCTKQDMLRVEALGNFLKLLNHPVITRVFKIMQEKQTFEV